ncbi:cytochrome c oxidase cbb3-type subunit 4 [Tistlia consotensis]|uniref:Cytochrome c oxidase cbb3-type subunit 4 n=1 Tax=Tistlia consotensis USBA 355 TaxID=560819 RepID=A0A1Y6C1E9_9PROT|nr:cbb3-type cytochrome c oxidase subunit 3 [Tistlia consotensis]SMF40466.1 cytochrome c oxidase cbb3-type subunit 4 [Tistlia consotensis USBA 355]SNR74901.1 cytochrome c oxidase cbb3-type subunit 4 [Tistlia consotensis]
MEELSHFMRNLWVVWLMAIFVGIVAWAYWPSRRRRQSLQEQANIPLRDDEDDVPPARGQSQGDRRPK